MGDLGRNGGVPGSFGVFSKNVNVDLDAFLDFRAESDGVGMW